MNNFYVPYQGNEPAAVCIKGHNFIILSRERNLLEDNLDLMGADNLREVVSISDNEEDEILDMLAREINGGIVIAPTDVEVTDIIDNLETELPWLQ